MRVRRGWARLATGAGGVLLVAVLVLAACSSGPDRRFAADVARTADVVERVSAPGAVQAAAQADLNAPAAAKIQDLRVRDGQRVRRGQLVAQLSSSQVDDSIRQAQSALSSASALDGLVPNVPVASAVAAIQQVQQQLSSTSDALLRALRSTLAVLPPRQRDQIAARLDRAERQVADGQRRANQAADLAVAAVDQQTNALRDALSSATAAQRGQAQLALDLAMDQKAQLTLRAPIAGTVQLGRGGVGGQSGVQLPDLSQLPESAQQAVQGLAGGNGGQGGGTGPPLRTGDQLRAGQTVATVFDVSRLQVASEVDETDIALVKVGQPADVQLDAFPGASFGARVRRVAVAPSSGQSASGGVTYEVDLALARDDGGPSPRVGMTATADIQVRQARAALSVPGSALIGRDRGEQAVLVIEGGKVHLRDVRVSVDGEDRAAIAAGLRQGERVVSRGAERLHDGERWPGG